VRAPPDCLGWASDCSDRNLIFDGSPTFSTTYEMAHRSLPREGPMEPQEAPTAMTSGVEEIVRIVVYTLAAEKEYARVQSENRWKRLADDIKSYWPLIAAVGSLGLALLAWLTLQISPRDSYRQMAERKQERKYQQEMAQRHLQIGVDFLNVNQIQPAKAEFTRVRELEPYNVQAEVGLLKVSVFEMFEPTNIDAYDPEIAERRLSANLQQHKDDTHVLTLLGMVYRVFDPKEAEANFDKAIAAGPENALAYFQKGFLLDLRGDRVEALRLYSEASRRSKWNQPFLNNLCVSVFPAR
jgi:tetratricopeptide (TPR) repeat protein